MSVSCWSGPTQQLLHTTRKVSKDHSWQLLKRHSYWISGHSLIISHTCTVTASAPCYCIQWKDFQMNLHDLWTPHTVFVGFYKYCNTEYLYYLKICHLIPYLVCFTHLYKYWSLYYFNSISNYLKLFIMQVTFLALCNVWLCIQEAT